MHKRITNESWKFQLKYSQGVTKRCESEHARVSGFEKEIKKNSASIANKMETVLEKFNKQAKVDLHAWNCEEMYPEP